MAGYKLGSFIADEMFIDLDDGNGGVAIDEIYLGTELVWPIDDNVGGSAELTSTSTLRASTIVEASIISTSTLGATGQLNNEKQARASLESTSTLEAGALTFQMYITSITEPIFLYPEFITLNVVEESSGYWHVYSTENVERLSTRYIHAPNRDNITKIEVILGGSLLNLAQGFYGLENLEEFVWHGECNVTVMTSCFANCSSLVNITLPDTSNVTDMAYTWNNCSSLTGTFPTIDTSSVTTLQNTWKDCSGITHIPAMDTSLVTNFSQTFSGMTALTSVGAIDTSSGTSFYGVFIDCVSLICLTSFNTINQTNTANMFSNCYALTAPNASEQTSLLTGSNYVNANACPFTTAPPIYLMTEDLVTDGVYWYLVNSSPSGTIYNGRLEHSTQSVDGNEGDPWQPTSGQYTKDGTINLNANGNATRQINTQWTPSPTIEWNLSHIYNVDMGVSYDMYSLDYNGDNTVDIWLGDNYGGVKSPMTLMYSNVPFTPPIEPWIIYETPPDIITLNELVYNMDSFTTT